MKMTDPRTNAIIVTQIIEDTIEEYRDTCARMRSYEIMAAQDKFSAIKFTLHPTEFLQNRERDIIDNEMENEVRRKSWPNEARAQVILPGT
jgi:hypothetical protein